MSTFFDSISNRRHQLDQQEYVGKRKAYLNQIAPLQACYRYAQECQSLVWVKVVLETFLKTAYDDFSLRTYELGWSLGKWNRQPDGSAAWEVLLDITVRFDAHGRANRLECWGHNRRLLVAATPTALEKALTRIYNPYKISA